MSASSSTGAARARLLLEASRHPLARRCAAGLSACGEAAAGRLALLVSGGGDSMALLALVAAIREREDPSLGSLAVLTVDHGLRGEAAGECRSALRLAAELGIARAECAAVVVEPRGNLLDRARAARLAAARDFVERHGCVAAATAHTADDRAESLLMALRRGAGLAAAARLRPVRRFTDGSAPTLVRPLLAVRRAELRAFLADLGLSWHEDPSNALHERGAMRADPVQAELVDGIARGASRLCDEAAELIAHRDAEIEERLGLAHGRRAAAVPRATFDLLPQAYRAAAIALFARAHGAEPAHEVIERAAEALARGERAPLRLECGGGLELVIDAREVAFRSLR